MKNENGLVFMFIQREREFYSNVYTNCKSVESENMKVNKYLHKELRKSKLSELLFFCVKDVLN